MRVAWCILLTAVTQVAWVAAEPGFLDGDISSPNGSCGETTGYTCYGSLFGNCCGPDGKCGTTPDVCGTGCQLKYGFCNKTKGQTSPQGRCGGDTGFSCKGSGYGDCCSAYGFCGSQSAYCGSGCQPEFGDCGSTKRDVEKKAITCPAAQGLSFTAANGKSFSVECGIDHSGGDISGSAAYVTSIEDCLELCSKTAGCINVSWVRGLPRGICYPKNALKPAKSNSQVIGGRMIGTSTASTPSAGQPTTFRSATGSIGSTMTKPSTPSTPSTPSSSPSAPVLLCPARNGNTYNDACGASYVLECESDRPGGDLKMVYTTGLDTCIRECSKTPGCVAVSWVKGSPNGPCYLKKSKGPAKSNNKVFGARQISACSPRPGTTSTSISASAPTTVSLSSRLSSLVSSSAVRPTTSLPNDTSRTLPSSAFSQSMTPPISQTTTSSVRAITSPSSTEAMSSATPTTCGSVAAPTADYLPNCRRCEGQPGNDRFCGYDLNTNYYTNTPKTCKVVTYNLEITNTTIAPDGVSRLALLINNQMPGPTIRASWGDTVVVHVHNKMQDNGTSIHFHGIRQLNNNMNDGVVSITQCPIAPGQSMTYTFVAENYGTSWYHSHYALQTWEGVFGPLIVDGPHGASFDKDLGAYLLQDWTHRPVDTMYDLAQNATPIPGRADGATFGGPQTMDTGLINGLNVDGADGTANQTGKRLELEFEPGRSHLLRIVNCAIQSTYKFSIDGHTMTVIAADFVPIIPYQTNVLTLSIGQRYHVIVHADADADAGNYWMRADNQESCAHTIQNRNIKAIVRYSSAKTSLLPTSTAYSYTDSCVDEPSESLVPVVSLNAGPADITEGTLDVVIRPNGAQLYKWFIAGTTFSSKYGDPTLLDIYKNNSVPDYSGNLLINIPKRDQMVYVVVESRVPLPHPLHLHGHDFWILAAGPGAYNDSIPLNLANPPRRDTVLMPAAGYVVIAFVTDNPGAWLMHCHIGWHVSMGFALQFVVMQDFIAGSGALANSCALVETCASWNAYATADYAMLDSGV